MANAARFSRDLSNFAKMVGAREELLYNRVVAHIHRSILDGSEVTGAPGQPVDTGDLYLSWKERGSRAARSVDFYSELPYAPIIEDNWRGAQLRSPVGGFHSVKLTVAAFDAIVRHELRRVQQEIRPGRGFSKFKDVQNVFFESGTAATFDPRGRGSRFRDPSTGHFTTGR